MKRTPFRRRVVLGWALLGLAAVAAGSVRAEGGPTPEEYVQQVGGDARIVPV